MEEYQRRVINEKADLDARIDKLIRFVSSDDIKSLKTYDAGMLFQQLDLMTQLSKILYIRIDRF